MRQFSRSLAVLFLILVLEGIIYSPNFQNFYCGDSLFWFSNTVKSWKQLLKIFSSIDGLGQYRPFTFVFYTFVVHPIAGMSLFRQHLFPLIFHGFNTLLVYWISRRVFMEPRQALTSAFSFGVSATAAYITYDNAFLPDYLYVMLFLVALVFLTLQLDTGRVFFGALAFAAFGGSLLSKEAGVTLPAAALAYLFVVRSRGLRGIPQPNPGWNTKRILLTCLPNTCASLLYLGFHLWNKGGSLYPSNPRDPHSLHLSLSSLQSKLPFILQALGAPKNPISGWVGNLGYWLVCLFVCWMAVCTIAGLRHRNGIYQGGLIWAAVTIAPALFILANSWEQNMYLPLIGISWIFSQSIEDLSATVRFARSRFCPVLVGLPVLLLYTWATAGNATVARDSSWMAAGSKITENCLKDLQRMYPYIPHDTLIYIETNREKNIVWHFDSGNLASTFYGDRSIRMRFSDDGLPPPESGLIQSGGVIVLKYLEGRLFDATLRRRLEGVDKATYRIRNHWKEGTALFAGKVIAEANHPETSVFPYELGLNNSGRDTLVLVAGSSYIHSIPNIPRGSQLRFGVAIASQRGTGLDAELALMGPLGYEQKLYSRRFSTGIREEPHAWDDKTLDLTNIEGSGYKLKMSAKVVPGTNSAGNWLEWGPLEIVPPESRGLEAFVSIPPPQPKGLVFHPSSIKRGERVTIEVVGGTDMEIDCQYTLNSSSVRVLNNWLLTDGKGMRQLKVDTAGHYVITAIRNSRRPDWVPVHYEWDCW